MKTKQFRIGPLSTLGEVVHALGKTIRAMSDGSIDSQVGARICNGLGILRTCLETLHGKPAEYHGVDGNETSGMLPSSKSS